MLDYELLIKYFLDKANILSLEYEEQIKKAFELDMGDYYTEDIANDWLPIRSVVIEKRRNHF